MALSIKEIMSNKLERINFKDSIPEGTYDAIIKSWKLNDEENNEHVAIEYVIKDTTVRDRWTFKADEAGRTIVEKVVSVLNRATNFAGDGLTINAFLDKMVKEKIQFKVDVTYNDKDGVSYIQVRIHIGTDAILSTAVNDLDSVKIETVEEK